MTVEKTSKKRRKRKKKLVGQKGGYRPHTKLTREQVVEIWALLYEGKLSQREIAEKFGVIQEAISHINTGSRWNEVTGLPKRNKHSTTPPPSGVRQGRPRGSRKAFLRKPRKADMKKLTDACVGAILRSKKFITIRMSATFKPPESWPTMRVVEATYQYKIYSVSSKKLLDWLHKNKYTDVSVEQVDNVVKDFGIFAALSSTGLERDLLEDLIN